MCEKVTFILLLVLLFPFLSFVSFHLFSFPSFNVFCIRSTRNERNSFCRWQQIYQSISKGFHEQTVDRKRKVNFSICLHKKPTILTSQKHFNLLNFISHYSKETTEEFHTSISNYHEVYDLD